MKPNSRRVAGLATMAVAVGVLTLSGCTSNDSGSSPTTSVASTNAATQQVAKLLQDGITYAQAGQLDQAATTFANVLSLDPTNKYAFYNLGLIAQTRNDSANAIAYYDKALTTDPVYQPAMYNKAIILEGTNLDQAIALYEQIVGINDKASTAYFRLSICYQLKGDQTKAKAARDKAIALDPSLANAPTATAPGPTTSAPAPASPSSTTSKKN